jgi:hypothetical protein
MKMDSTVLKIKSKNNHGICVNLVFNIKIYFFDFNKVQRNILYTPGPLMTSETVKKAMLRDIGAGEIEFKQIVENCRKILIDIARIKIDI